MTSSQGSTVTGRLILACLLSPTKDPPESLTHSDMKDEAWGRVAVVAHRKKVDDESDESPWIFTFAMNISESVALWPSEKKKRLSLNWNPVKDPGDFWRIRGSGLRFGLYFEIQTNYQKLGVCSHDRLATVLCHFCVYSLCHFSM